MRIGPSSAALVNFRRGESVEMARTRLLRYGARQKNNGIADEKFQFYTETQEPFA
jgi:hypothetical protein